MSGGLPMSMGRPREGKFAIAIIRHDGGGGRYKIYLRGSRVANLSAERCGKMEFQTFVAARVWNVRYHHSDVGGGLSGFISLSRCRNE
jgi:hypothetical protein